MANRRGGLLAQIEAHVVDDGVPLSSLLQECVVLGARAGSEKMRDWARWELHGYTGADTVPEYRHFHAVLMAVITNNAGYNAITDRIHEDVFGDQIRDVIREAIGDIEDAFLPQGISQLAEGLAAAAEKEADPERKTRLRQAAGLLGGAVRDIAVDIAERFAERAAGLG